MSQRARFIGLLTLVLAALLTAAVPAEVKTRGEIVGTVVGPDGAALGAATVTLASDVLIQSEVQESTAANGRFRFPNLLPGHYKVTVARDSFASRVLESEVSVGRTTTLDVQLQVEGVTEELLVRSEAPLIDRGAPALATGFDAQELEKLPTTRNFLDIADAAPGFHNRAAYGAGGNVEGYDYFGFGAATNSYQLNGVSTNNLRFGNTWVIPNYDTIQEIQLTGPGGSVEYADYSGATVNVVTKSGTNAFHGTGSAVYTNHDLLSDNSEGIKDLEQPTTKNYTDLAGTVGGPLAREKLTFFLGLSTNRAQNAPVDTDFYDDLDRQSHSLRLDWQANPSHTVTGMYTAEPIDLTDLGLQAGFGAEVGFARFQDTYTGYLSWLGIWGANTVSEARWANVDGESSLEPNAGPDVTGLIDLTTGNYHNSRGIARAIDNKRDHVLASITHYADEFLGSSHEFKVGLDYEDAWSKEDQVTGGQALMAIVPLGPGLNLIYAIVNYHSHTAIALERTGAFAQDKISFAKATLSLGVRYDEPETSDDNTGATIFDFENVSPRLGFAYDFSGNGRSVGRASWGRYYDKVPTYGVGGYAGTGQGPWYYYIQVTPFAVDPGNAEALAAATIQPQNLLRVFETSLVPIEAGIDNPRTDTWSLGFDQQIGRRSALTASFINRESTDYIVLTQFANAHIYTPFTYTAPFNGRTFELFHVENPQVQRQFGLGNRGFNEQETQMAIVQFRHRATDNLEFDASVTWEDSNGTRDNNEVGILSLMTNGVDTNPNFEQNPFYIDGALSQEREWNVKLRGFYFLPLGFGVGADARWYDGRPYGAKQSCPTIPGCNDPYYNRALIEPKDARRSDDNVLVNLRLSKDFRFGAGSGYTLALLADVLNVLNEQIDVNTNIHDVTTDIYPMESVEQGQQVSSFGRPFTLDKGREYRLGARFQF